MVGGRGDLGAKSLDTAATSWKPQLVMGATGAIPGKDHVLHMFTVILFSCKKTIAK